LRRANKKRKSELVWERKKQQYFLDRSWKWETRNSISSRRDEWNPIHEDRRETFHFEREWSFWGKTPRQWKRKKILIDFIVRIPNLLRGVRHRIMMQGRLIIY
jgi:hypothetical protein